MINRISQGEANGILTWKLNRLARNPVEGGQISWMLQNQMIKHIQKTNRKSNKKYNTSVTLTDCFHFHLSEITDFSRCQNISGWGFRQYEVPKQ